MRRWAIGILLGCVLVSGCVSRVWVKPGSTQQDFNVDTYQCEKDARQSGYFGRGIAGDFAFHEFQQRCMVAHGWTLQIRNR